MAGSGTDGVEDGGVDFWFVAARLPRGVGEVCRGHVADVGKAFSILIAKIHDGGRERAVELSLCFADEAWQVSKVVYGLAGVGEICICHHLATADNTALCRHNILTTHGDDEENRAWRRGALLGLFSDVVCVLPLVAADA